MDALPLRRAARADGSPARGVAIVGEALVDRFADAAVAGGAPFNVARSLAALGLPVTLVTRIGRDDAAGALVLKSARRFGLPLAGFQLDETLATGAVSIVERAGAHQFHIQPDAAWDYIDLAAARRVLQAANPRVIYFGTLAQRCPASRATIRTLLRETDALRFLDLNLRDGQDNRPLAADSLALADWVKVNEIELMQLIAWFVPRCDATAPHGTPERRLGILRLAERFVLTRLIVTRGAHGYAAFDQRARCVARGPGESIARVVDTVGAGDAFSAAVLALHMAKRSLRDSLLLANRYAAAICGRRGPIPDDDAFFAAWRAALGLERAPRLTA